MLKNNAIDPYKLSFLWKSVQRVLLPMLLKYNQLVTLYTFPFLSFPFPFFPLLTLPFVTFPFKVFFLSFPAEKKRPDRTGWIFMTYNSNDADSPKCKVAENSDWLNCRLQTATSY